MDFYIDGWIDGWGGGTCLIKGNHEYYFAEYLYLAGKKIRRNDWTPGLAAGGSLDWSPGRLEDIENFWFH